nr:TetR/AcrR family transcriptional regulator [uncultured Pseudodesulfovibrio sp.]
MAKKQQEKSQQTMQELMDSAIELFGSKGFASTSVAEITDHAGYAKGSFYRHWNSKDELFLQIVERKFKQYRATRHDKIVNAENLEQAMNIIWDFLETIVHDKNWSSIFLEFTVYSATNDPVRKLMNKSDYRLSNKVFADLVRDHVETDFSPEKIGALNTALFEGYLIHHALGAEELSLKDIRENAIAMALRNGTKQGRIE